MIVSLIILALATNSLNKNQQNKQILPKLEQNVSKTYKILKIKNIELNVYVADTTSSREKGLSGRERLGENEGMLFVFERERYYGIWMKDMNFPIDIAWLDKDKKIVYVEKNVSPETYPKVFYAQKGDVAILSLFVLEIQSGFLVKNNIQIGDQVAF